MIYVQEQELRMYDQQNYIRSYAERARGYTGSLGLTLNLDYAMTTLIMQLSGLVPSSLGARPSKNRK